MKHFLAFILVLSLFTADIHAADSGISEPQAASAILMESSTGQILYEKNADERRSPASVTKLMTMLLACEAIDLGTVSPEDSVIASARAAGMGGSQIWLEEGETMSFSEMLKCITVVSANDCCVAVAEHLCGSEEAFVAKMNQRADELGLENTHFLCSSGLSDSSEHYSSARDLAIISRELLKHELIREYTAIRIDTIRGGEFGLTNTNKLISRYEGATGLKTGFTSKAGHCLAATAMRDGVEYIAVILGGESSAARFDGAKALLDYAFANYCLVSPAENTALPPVKISMGKADCVSPVSDCSEILVRRDEAASLHFETELPESISAPLQAGSEIGTLRVYSGDKLIEELPLTAAESVEKMSLFDIFARLMASVLVL